MGQAIDPPLMTEPMPVPCHFIDQVAIELHTEYVRICGSVELETVRDGSPPERRIVARIAMPLRVARALIRDLRHAIIRDG